MGARFLQHAFSAGEITPELFGRLDIAKRQEGLALCQNFITLPHGPAINRAGTIFVKEVKNSANATRIIPFSYNNTQTFAIELGAGYFRFHTGGGTLLYSTPAAWVTATPYAVGALVANGGTNYYCTTAHTSGTFATDLAAGDWYALPADMTYEIPNPYAAADLMNIHYTQSADVLTLVHQNYAPMELRRYGSTNWQMSAPSFNAPTNPLTGLTAAATGTGSTTYSYVVTKVSSIDGQESVAYATPASVTNDLTVAGHANKITWTDPANTTNDRYNVYKDYYVTGGAASGVYGYIGQAASLNFTDDNILADKTKTPPISTSVLNSSSNYPAAVGYYQQRRVFAGTITAPQNVWMTRSGTESNMGYTIPTQDDNRVAFRIAAREASAIRHVVPVRTLILLSASTEWQVSSPSGVLTPTSLSVDPQSYVGANNVQPVVVNNIVLFAASRGGHLREMSYNWQAQGYLTGDISLFAAHLFDYYNLVDMAYSRSPYPIVWCVSSTGTLLGMTYVPEQQIAAWHQHVTGNGDKFESICTVTETTVTGSQDDVLYAIVNRTINGVQKRYVECFHSRYYSTVADAFFVDCGGTYYNTGTYTVSGTTMTCVMPLHGFTNGQSYLFEFSDSNYGVYPGTTYTVTVIDANTFTITVASGHSASGTITQLVTSISGINWLNGMTVNILADGAVMPQQVVSGGVITLSVPAAKVQAGLPITSKLQTAPAWQQMDNAMIQGRAKNVNKIFMRVYRSSGILAGPDFNDLRQYAQRTTENYGAPPNMVSDEIELVLTPTWAQSGQVCVEQSDPLPLDIASLTLEIAVGGGI